MGIVASSLLPSGSSSSKRTAWEEEGNGKKEEEEEGNGREGGGDVSDGIGHNTPTRPRVSPSLAWLPPSFRVSCLVSSLHSIASSVLLRLSSPAPFPLSFASLPCHSHRKLHTDTTHCYYFYYFYDNTNNNRRSVRALMLSCCYTPSRAPSSQPYHNPYPY